MRISDWSSDVCSSDLFLEPAGYASSGDSYNPVYGGSPLSDHIVQYRRFAPSLNAAKVCTPVLQQVASASPSQAQLFEALRSERVPTQLSYYPGSSSASDETHLFHIPSNRLLAMRSEEHTSELQSLMRISYAVFCLNKKTNIN